MAHNHNHNATAKAEHDNVFRVKRVSNFADNGEGSLERESIVKPIQMADSASIDAFARMRISNPETLIFFKAINSQYKPSAQPTSKNV